MASAGFIYCHELAVVSPCSPFQTLLIHSLLCFLDSLVVECWLPVREVPSSIPSQGPRHTKDVIKMVLVVPLFSTEHYGSFSRIKIRKLI